MELKELKPYFYCCIETNYYDGDIIKVGKNIAVAICYTFDITLPSTETNDAPYIFSDAQIDKINSQLSLFKFKQDSNGKIPIGQLLMLSNMDAFPYKLIGCNSIFQNGKSYTYYHFMLKVNPASTENIKGIKI